MHYFSPAKLNLFLQVVGKQDDYHLLSTLMQTIDFGDDLFIEKSDHDRFTCSDKMLERQDNLIIKALKLFQTTTGFDQKVVIHLEKKVPYQMGLGGGSSNAATTLFALNQLAGSPLTLIQLQEMSKKLGADVPFFFSQGTALCENIGDVVTNVTIPSYTAYLIMPPYQCSTPSVYSKVTSFSEKQPELFHSWQQKAPKLHNDLQSPAFAVTPALKQFYEKLHQLGFNKISLTGSGAGFFALEGQEDALEKCLKVRFLNRSSISWYQS